MPSFDVDGPLWAHMTADLKGIGNVIRRALGRAQQSPPMGWTEGALLEATSDFRALLVGAAFLYDVLSTVPSTVTAEVLLLGTRTPEQFSSTERWAMANAPLWSMRLLYERGLKFGDYLEPLPGTEPRIQTQDGSPATELKKLPTGAGAAPAWIVPGIALVAGAIVICFIADRAADVVDKRLKREEDSALLMATTGKMMEVLREHRELEQKAGKELPFTDAEKAVLGTLKEQWFKYQETTAKGPEVVPPLTAREVGGWLLLLAAAALVLYFMTRPRSQSVALLPAKSAA